MQAATSKAHKVGDRPITNSDTHECIYTRARTHAAKMKGAEDQRTCTRRTRPGPRRLVRTAGVKHPPTSSSTCESLVLFHPSRSSTHQTHMYLDVSRQISTKMGWLALALRRSRACSRRGRLPHENSAATASKRPCRRCSASAGRRALGFVGVCLATADGATA